MMTAILPKIIFVVHAQKCPRCKMEQGFKRGILFCSMLSAEAAVTAKQMDVFQRELPNPPAFSKMSVYRRHPRQWH